MQTHTDQQIQALKSDYEKQLTALSKEVSGLQGKVQSFNELLTFTKDNANNKTDNSNKLYTQLNEVKQQLNTLQKKMDLLK
jgi:phage host-nuclease inhibitor protein Gam